MADGTVRTDTLKVPGATLHYEVRGSGPVLLLIPGGPTDADVFAGFAPALTNRYTVVTYDPRGLSRSPLDGQLPEEVWVTVADQAEDAHHLLAAMGTEPACVLGSSGGALTGLELVAHHPEQVRVLVAHEPPVTELLPDREEHSASTREIYDLYRREGVGAAMAKFAADAELDGGEEPTAPEEPTPEMLEGMARMQGNMDFFLARMWWGMDGYVPDATRLRAAPTRVVVGVGESSRGQLAHRSAVAVAEHLGTAPTVFPGDHGGFATYPEAFADQLHELLRA